MATMTLTTHRERTELLQGTLDMLILRALILGLPTATKSPNTFSARATRSCASSTGRSTPRSIGSRRKAGSRRSGTRTASTTASARTTGPRPRGGNSWRRRNRSGSDCRTPSPA